MKVYIVEYCANEFDDICHDRPYPIYISLDKDKAYNFFKDCVQKEIDFFNELLKEHQEYQNNEDWQIAINEENHFEIYRGNWKYEYVFDEFEFDIDLRY